MELKKGNDADGGMEPALSIYLGRRRFLSASKGAEVEKIYLFVSSFSPGAPTNGWLFSSHDISFRKKHNFYKENKALKKAKTK